MSLGSFFRDNVYIPLGGNRKRVYLNILVVWGLTGFWHGADWNFLIWGLYYAALLSLERLFLKRALDRLPRAFSMAVTFVLVNIGWVFFYNTDLTAIPRYFSASGPFIDTAGLHLIANSLPLLLLCAIASAPVARLVGKFKHSEALEGAYALCMLVLSTILLAGDTYNPFIYFKF
jgi:alginate O-acetyltransferase complex protein AlgI